MSRNVLLLAIPVIGVLAFLAGSQLGAPVSGSRPAEAPEREAELRAEVARLTESEHLLSGKLAEATTRYREAEAALSGTLPPVEDAASGEWRSGRGAAAGAGGGAPDGSGGAGASREGPEASRPVLFADDYEGALRKVDWATVGGNLHRMLRILDDGAPRILRGEGLPEDAGTAIQKLNSPVLAAAIQIRDYLPGRAVGDKFTSAPFALNAVAATLAAAGLPLDAAQEDRFLALGRDYLARDVRRQESYGPETFELERLLDDLALKQDFYASAFSSLTAAQAATLRPEPTRDRVRLDLFSPAMALSQRIETLTFADEDDLLRRMGSRIASGVGLTQPQYAPAAATLKDWAAAIPRDLLDAGWDTLDARGMVTVDRASAWGRQLLALLRSMVADLSLADPQAAKARTIGNIVVGLRTGRGPG
ncbi:MAG: hypothetical protein MUE73_00910 [Planctomycetes bacterium]|nr:hypothetical protein [Planctomycetota bacterium]